MTKIGVQTSVCTRLAPAPALSTRADDDRTIDYIFSDESVARDGHTIANDGWVLDNFLKNPVFLWAHDSSAPPIGKVVKVDALDDQLRGVVRYASQDEYPFADTIFRLTKGGFLNAVSVSWLPIDWRQATDRKRPGGIDFLRQELLEVSAVPVPALASALVTARSAGIDTKPLFDWAERALDLGGFAVLPRAELEALRREAKMPASARASKASDWKVGAARDLPVDEKDSWDGAAAADRMIEAATSDDKIDADKAKRGFLIYDAASPDLKGSYKEPFADIVDGKLTAIAGGIHAAASRLPQVDGASEEVKAEARKVLDAYEEKLKGDDDKRAVKATRALGATLRKRGLYELSGLCDLICYADYVCRCVEAEAADEGDGSPIAPRMRAWVNEGNLIIAAMAAEETQENIDGTQGSAYRGLKGEVARQVRQALAAIGLSRAGKVLSEENARCLREALDHHQRGCDMVRSVLKKNEDDADPEDDDPAGDNDDDDERALRIRKAAARRRKVALSET